MGLFETEFRTINEFPEFEINLQGEIRRKDTRVPRPTHSGYYGEVIKFTKDGHRYLRSVEKLRRIAFSVSN
jgi:hypothetical protein